MARSDKLYSDSPRLERDDESGKVETKKPSKKAEKEPGETGTEGMAVNERHAHERREVHHHHIAEHLATHHRNEMEHTHEKGDKKALHERHEQEFADMRARHGKELKALHDRHEKGETAKSEPKTEK